KIIYPIMALFALSILFVGIRTSSSQEFQEGTIALYGQSDIRGWDTLEASGMIGVQLLTPEGDYMGQISDLVIDPGTGHILEAVLSDVPGEGGKSITVPFAALSHTGANLFAFNRPEEFIGRFRDDESPSLEQPFTHWAETRFLYSVRPLPMGAFSTSTLIGASVQTSKGEEVAQVNDLVIDFRNDQVVYSVLSDVGGSEGRMVAVPFSELSKSGRNLFTLHTTKERLLDSPAFTEIDMTNLRYAENVYRYFGVQPYWEEK
ncbi:MAG TPA: PRC-barrel domain-containing protein, partial [Thermodesulfobacteriota bacterium]|nr:PRC-barrel domain-containing protein [Thermodesulfobacteriota bacterium]